MNKKEKLKIKDELVKTIKEWDNMIEDGNYNTLSNIAIVLNNTEYTYTKEGEEKTRERSIDNVVPKNLIGEKTVLLVYDGGNLYSIMNNEFGDTKMHRNIDNIAEKHGYYWQPVYKWTSILVK